MDTRTGEIFQPDEPMDREKRRRMERAQERGEFVAVSEQVAQRMELGRLEEQRRETKALRKAVKAARRANRKAK